MYPGYPITTSSYAPSAPFRNTVKRRLKVFGVYLLFVNVFGVLIKSPISLFYLVYGGYPMLFVDLLFFIIYFTDRIYNKGRGLSRFEWWVILMLLYILTVSGIMANIYYGQPVFTGMAAEKSWLAILISILFFYLMKTKAIDLTIIRDSLIFGAWFQLPVFLLLIATLNANRYAGTLFVYCNTVKGGCQFEFDIFVFAFASIYYFIRFVKTNKIWYGLFFLIFFAYIFFVNQKRGTSLALGGTLFLYFIFNLKRDKIIIYLLGFITFLGFTVGLLYFLLPDLLERIQTMYGNVILVLMGQQTNEASADARIRETMIALKYFERNSLSWLFGNGKTDNEWIGQPADLDHYYPSDIGMLGIVWQFGMIGLVLGLYQYWLVLRNHRRIKTFRKNIFYQAVLYFIIFFFVRSIPTGGSWFDPGIAIGATFVAIHYFFYYIERHPDRNYLRPV